MHAQASWEGMVGVLTEGVAILYVQTNGLWVVVAITTLVGWGKQAGGVGAAFTAMERLEGENHWIPRCRKQGW